MLSDYFRIITISWKIPKTIYHLSAPILYFPTSILISSLHASPHCTPLAQTSPATLGPWLSLEHNRHAHGSGFYPWHSIILECSSPITCMTCSPTSLGLPQMSFSQWVLPSTLYLKWTTYPSTPSLCFCFFLHSTYRHLTEYTSYSYSFSSFLK